MDKVKIGIPRSIYYYYYGNLWERFFKKLNIDFIVSPNTNKEILQLGNYYANDEMCLSLKVFLGHVAYLKDKCDYILIPRIDNYGLNNQTCTNFLAIYDITNNVFNKKIINYNIDVYHNETELKAFLKLGKILGKKKKEVKQAYSDSKLEVDREKDRQIDKTNKLLESDKLKILIVGHSYNLHDSYIGSPIVEMLKNLDAQIIYSDNFSNTLTNKMSKTLSSELYFKYSKEIIGSIPLCSNNIDGIIFLSTFPCGPDSLVNELVMRKIKLPYLNLIIDDIDAYSGIETRIESFIDIVIERKNKDA